MTVRCVGDWAAMAVLDPEFAAVLEERSGWRREGLRTLLGRLAKQTGRPKPKEVEQVTEMVQRLVQKTLT